MTSQLWAAIALGLIGLLATPLIHIAIRSLPSHFPVRRFGLNCATCGTRPEGTSRIGALAHVTGKSRCSTCGKRLWPDFGWLEVATVVFMAVAGWQLDWSLALPAYAVFFLCAIAIAVIDLRQYIIPTKAVYLAVVAGLLNFALFCAVNGDWSRFTTAVLTMIGLRLFYFIFWFLFPAGMGYGDVRLATAVGLFTGWIGVGNAIIALFVGLLVSSMVGLFMVIVRMKTMKSALPHGPFMLLGATVSILFAQLWANVLA